MLHDHDLTQIVSHGETLAYLASVHVQELALGQHAFVFVINLVVLVFVDLIFDIDDLHPLQMSLISADYAQLHAFTPDARPRATRYILHEVNSLIVDPLACLWISLTIGYLLERRQFPSADVAIGAHYGKGLVLFGEDQGEDLGSGEVNLAELDHSVGIEDIDALFLNC